jgi:hypothetical protein
MGPDGRHGRRQRLAAYAFFEEAQKSNSYSEDALIPLILPAIAGKAGEIFSSDALAKALQPVFGPELVNHLAESLVESLNRQGYLEPGPLTSDGAIYLYTQKASEIAIGESVSRAEHDLDLLMDALADYLGATRTIKPVVVRGDELRMRLIDWLTTAEMSRADAARGLESTAGEEGSGAGVDRRSPDQIEILFSSFLAWLSRERASLFDKAMTFVELGLVIDLVSELRVPTRRPKQMDLIVVLDTSVLLDLLGACGPVAQVSAVRLADLCKKHRVDLITLTHLVDEVREIAYNCSTGSDPYFRGSVNDAVRKYPQVMEILKRINRSPDSQIKAVGVRVLPYTHIHDVKAMNAFTSDDIDDFAAALPYDKSKPRMAERDAKSLAYALRRQNGTYSSSLYDSKCSIVTRSRVFVSTCKKFLRDHKAFPYYAVTPVIELRHFSTLFLLVFGSDAGGKVVRAELVASCDRIVQASPHLLTKIRGVLARTGQLSDEQIDAALSDPVTLAELTLTTGNDATLVTPQNGPALLEVVRSATIKEEELRHLEKEKDQKEAFENQLNTEKAKLNDTERRAEGAEAAAAQQREINRQLADERQADAVATAEQLVREIMNKVRLLWLIPIAIGIVCGGLLTLDAGKEFTGLTEHQHIILIGLLALFFVYSCFALVMPEVEPRRLRTWLTRRVSQRHLKLFPAAIREQVQIRLQAEKWYVGH